MGFFDQFNKNGSSTIKAKAIKVKKEQFKSLKPQSAPKVPHVSSSETSSAVSRPKQKVAEASKTNGARERSNTPVTIRKRPKPSQGPLLSSSEEDTGDEDISFARKKLKRSPVESDLDPDRILRASKIAPPAEVAYINGATIASVDNKKYKGAFDDISEGGSLRLDYPNPMVHEKFALVTPGEADEFRPLEDIIESVKTIAKYYIPETESKIILDETTGIVRKLEKARRVRNGAAFKAAVLSFNTQLSSLREQKILSQTIDSIWRPPLPLVERVLNQSYARTVSLKVDTLRKYENGTDNVYGELLPKFITTILTDARLTSSQVFVDLGSGVANVVLQAALEIGCESWGCEVMENACILAEAQEKEFHARCKMWDLQPGETHLERGDFLTNIPISKALRKADVVLVNNQAFTPALNDALTHLFLDLKEGCQIISLKSFVPHDHIISYRNANSPVNLLEVKEKVYYSGSVSWKDAPGTYYTAVKDSRKLRAFEKGRRN